MNKPLTKPDNTSDDNLTIESTQLMTAGELLTSQLLLVLLCTGWLVSTLAGFGIPSSIHIILATIFLLGWLGALTLYPWNLTDLRFLFAPVFILVIGWIAPYWTLPPLWDQAAHLQIANQFLDRWSWESSGQGLGFNFRPKIIPGIAAVEMMWSGSQYNLIFTPFFLLLGSAWILQHLAERWSNKSIGWIAISVFLTFPVIIVIGRSLLLDVALAGAVILTILKLFSAYEKNKIFDYFSLGFVAGCTGLTKYAYLYLGPYFLFLAFISQRQKAVTPLAFGWFFATLPFFLQNLFRHGSIFASLSTQVDGTVWSLTNKIDNYTILHFISDFMAEWSLLLLLAIGGSFWCWQNHRNELLISFIVIAPAIVLFGGVLDFGYSRYHTPWLLLSATFVPAVAMFEFDNLNFKWFKERNVNFATMITLLILLASLSNTVINLFDERDDILKSEEYRWGIVDMFLDVEDSLSEDSVVLASASTNFGLFTGIQSLNYERTENPIYDSIILTDATHVFTQEPGPKLEWEDNWTYLLGSPLTPVVVSYLGDSIAVLWSVNDTRMSSHTWWINASWNVEGNVDQFADVVVLDATASAEPPHNAAISRIVRIPDDISINEVAMLDTGISTSVENLCLSIVTCSELDRGDYLNERWIMWAVAAF